MGVLVSAPPPECTAPIDGPPGNFDAAINPTLAKHWDGLSRKRACGPRPLGPGERAAARACHERGLRVIDGGRS